MKDEPNEAQSSDNIHGGKGNSPARSGRKAKIMVAIKATISLLLLAYLIKQTDQEDLLSYVKSVPLWFVLFAWFYYSVCQWISAYRWQMFLAVKRIKVSMRKLFSFYMVGMFLNNFLPGAVGGDIVKTADLYRLTRNGNYAISSVFLERFTGLVGLAIIGVIASVWTFDATDSWLVLFSVLGVAAFLVVVLVVMWCEPLMLLTVKMCRRCLPSSVADKFSDLYAALHSYRKHPREMTLAILISIVLQLMFALYYGLFALLLGIDIDMVYFIVFLPAITLVTMLPISLGGLGVREALMVVLFAEVGIGSAEILSISLTVHVVNIGLSLWGGLILAFRKPIEQQREDDIALHSDSDSSVASSPSSPSKQTH
ncbi:lysylphosphatidylglycerol synthase transmembrane domain-containing protein [Litoribacillus peritrichatus]|uniref:Lysylphosphatidylglycerol synthase transmembrane domain-containing protein n=1 Tax=Litoribacillus peritrichatus TaxID=718191 RepID=A0ABP7M966_9GAMM